MTEFRDEAFMSLLGMVQMIAIPDLYCHLTSDRVWICVSNQHHFATLLNNQISRTWLVTHDWLEDPTLLDSTGAPQPLKGTRSHG